jgi:uracil-DNA glycosylase
VAIGNRLVIVRPESTATRVRTVTETLDLLGARARTCTRCPLAQGRTHVVFGEGDADAALMIVGEAPGADEDASGRPFVGPSGDLLNDLLAEIHLERSVVYIANVVKCRPWIPTPGGRKRNRLPKQDEIKACREYLDGQMTAVRPRVVISLGNTATRRLLGRPEGISCLRDHEYPLDDGRVLIPTFHPAFVNRRPQQQRPKISDDFARARRVLDRVLPA